MFKKFSIVTAITAFSILPISLPALAESENEKQFYVKAGYGMSFNNPALTSEPKHYTFEDDVK